MQNGTINNPPNPYVFRLQDINAMNVDWFISNEYTNNDINAIPDREQPTSDLFITSIPSPFAMMDMIRTSLKIINDQISDNNFDALKGDSVYHKLISNFLDVGEIFFNYDSYRNLVKIKKWSCNNEISRLVTSNNARHKLLGDTINLFFEQDTQNFNFNCLSDIYYLEYIGGVVNQNIIGGTSPITLFFPSPDAEKLPKINKINLTGRPIFSKINFNNQEYYQPLCERDFNYVIYLYYLSTLNNAFIELRTYIEKNIQYIQHQNNRRFNEIYQNFNRNRQDYINGFNDIQFQQEGNNYTVCIINNITFKQQILEIVQSDFIIKPTNQNLPIRLPLVLSREQFNGYQYVNNINWDINRINVPYRCSEENINNRVLPNTNINYPYLTVNDFLEEYIIETELKINSEYFFDCNYKNDVDRNLGVLIPIKDKFFEYFDVNFLMGYLNTGERVLEIRKLAGGNIQVKLRIPIQNGFVTLERIYHNTIANISESRNEGGYKKFNFGLAITPFINKEGNTLEKVIIIADNERTDRELRNNFKLRFYKGLVEKEVDREIILIRKSNRNIGLKGYILNADFDRIKINYGNKTFCVIPKFKSPNPNNSQYTFSVDFGASSTFISYKKDNGALRSLELAHNEPITKTLHNYETSDIYELINMYFLPQEIKESDNVLYKFPTISALQVKNADNIDYVSFLDVNISFHYYRVRQLFQHLNYFTNLKWSNYTLDQNSTEYRNIKAFIRSILFIIKYKVLADGGDLNNVKVIWFYPLSMVEHRYNDLKALWENCYTEIIYDVVNENLLSTSESLPPFYYYLNRYRDRIFTQELKLLLDVGASTTDILCFKNDSPIFASSFRFASRALFCEGIMNFIRRKINDELQNNEQNIAIQDLTSVFNDLYENGRSSYEIAEFCFSLKSHSRLSREQRQNLDFGRMLFDNENGKARIIILFYFSAIVYYAFKLTKLHQNNENVSLPKYIYLSGNGSNMFSYFDLNTLSRFSKYLLKRIFDTSEDINLAIIFDDEPKKLTSKGAYYINNTDYFNFETNRQIKAVYLGNYGNELISLNNRVNYSEKVVKENSNIYLKNDFKSDIVKEVINFLKVFLSLNQEINFGNTFGIQNLREFKSYVNNVDLEDILKGSLETFFREYMEKDLRNDLEQEINETFFFYPIIGFLNKVSFELLNNR